MGGDGRAEEVAATTVVLAPEDAGRSTGQNTRLHGGLTRAV